LVRCMLVVVFAGITLICLARLLGAARGGRRAHGVHDDVGHAVMGVGMVAMVLSWTDVLPTVVWVALFGGQAAFFAMTLVRPGGGVSEQNWDHTHHLMGSLGMLYMVVGMGGMTMAGVSPLAFSFGIYFLVFGVWSGLRAVRVVPTLQPAGASVAVLRRPLLVHGCRALMGGGMAYLLLAA
jgi:Domain of unknown function (DUF5134)